jgi:hypothetical protein
MKVAVVKNEIRNSQHDSRRVREEVACKNKDPLQG